MPGKQVIRYLQMFGFFRPIFLLSFHTSKAQPSLYHSCTAQESHQRFLMHPTGHIGGMLRRHQTPIHSQEFTWDTGIVKFRSTQACQSPPALPHLPSHKTSSVKGCEWQWNSGTTWQNYCIEPSTTTILLGIHMYPRMWRMLPIDSDASWSHFNI